MATVLCGCSSNSTTDTPPVAESAASSRDEQQRTEVDFQHPTVRIQTTAGEIVLKLDGEKAPGTVRNFLNYVSADFYSGTLIHYVDPGRMIQGGGYEPDGKLKETRLSILNEAHNGLKNKRGTIAMARNLDLIDSATTQFFINLADAPEFDHQGEDAESYGYCVFGTVVEGLDVADQISRVPTQDRGGDLVQSPRDPIVIESIDVVM